ncbi:hypothetical protein, partial [Providencia rettgeri]|uniref:hypothetical protein n=1 Tax=Providencia rettgeri TaxID=587 RepID=UPI002557A87F
AWGQVGPPRYCRQTNSVCSRLMSLLCTKPKRQSQTSYVSFTFRLLTHYQKQPNLSKTPSVLSG